MKRRQPWYFRYNKRRYYNDAGYEIPRYRSQPIDNEKQFYDGFASGKPYNPKANEWDVFTDLKVLGEKQVTELVREEIDKQKREGKIITDKPAVNVTNRVVVKTPIRYRMRYQTPFSLKVRDIKEASRRYKSLFSKVDQIGYDVTNVRDILDSYMAEISSGKVELENIKEQINLGKFKDKKMYDQLSNQLMADERWMRELERTLVNNRISNEDYTKILEAVQGRDDLISSIQAQVVKLVDDSKIRDKEINDIVNNIIDAKSSVENVRNDYVKQSDAIKDLNRVISKIKKDYSSQSKMKWYDLVSLQDRVVEMDKLLKQEINDSKGYYNDLLGAVNKHTAELENLDKRFKAVEFLTDKTGFDNIVINSIAQYFDLRPIDLREDFKTLKGLIGDQGSVTQLEMSVKDIKNDLLSVMRNKTDKDVVKALEDIQRLYGILGQHDERYNQYKALVDKKIDLIEESTKDRLFYGMQDSVRIPVNAYSYLLSTLKEVDMNLDKDYDMYGVFNLSEDRHDGLHHIYFANDALRNIKQFNEIYSRMSGIKPKHLRYVNKNALEVYSNLIKNFDSIKQLDRNSSEYYNIVNDLMENLSKFDEYVQRGVESFNKVLSDSKEIGKEIETVAKKRATEEKVALSYHTGYSSGYTRPIKNIEPKSEVITPLTISTVENTEEYERSDITSVPEVNYDDIMFKFDEDIDSVDKSGTSLTALSKRKSMKELNRKLDNVIQNMIKDKSKDGNVYRNVNKTIQRFPSVSSTSLTSLARRKRISEINRNLREKINLYKDQQKRNVEKLVKGTIDIPRLEWYGSKGVKERARQHIRNRIERRKKQIDFDMDYAAREAQTELDDKMTVLSMVNKNYKLPDHFPLELRNVGREGPKYESYHITESDIQKEIREKELDNPDNIK